MYVSSKELQGIIILATDYKKNVHIRVFMQYIEYSPTYKHIKFHSIPL